MSGVFRRIVEFGHDFNGVVCARKDLEGSTPIADPLMARFAQGLVEQNLGLQRHADLTAQVRELIVAL